MGRYGGVREGASQERASREEAAQLRVKPPTCGRQRGRSGGSRGSVIRAGHTARGTGQCCPHFSVGPSRPKVGHSLVVA